MRITDHWKDILIDRNRSSRCLRKLQLIYLHRVQLENSLTSHVTTISRIG